jgi:hypothetical protein
MSNSHIILKGAMRPSERTFRMIVREVKCESPVLVTGRGPGRGLATIVE